MARLFTEAHLGMEQSSSSIQRARKMSWSLSMVPTEPSPYPIWYKIRGVIFTVQRSEAVTCQIAEALAVAPCSRWTQAEMKQSSTLSRVPVATAHYQH